MEKENGFWAHLEDLRSMLLRSGGVLAACSVAAFLVVPHIFDDVILAPSTNDFPLYRLLGATYFDTEIININVASQFLTHMSTSLCMALICAFPYIIYEVWRFVSPALYENERQSVRFVFLLGTVMFYAGCATGYFLVFPLTFRFLAGYEISSAIAGCVSLDSYMSTFLGTIFIMGMVFELPLLIRMMSSIGITDRDTLRKYRRHAFVTLLVSAAIITPTGDPFTLAVVALPMYALYEAGILISKNRNTKNSYAEQQ